jgi:biopolymer transport protein ExbB
VPETHTLDSQILDLMLRAGSSWILWLLLGLSCAAIAVMLERLWLFARDRRPAGRLRAALEAVHRAGPAEAIRMLTGMRSMEARVVRSCLGRIAGGAEAVDEHRVAIIEHERQRYEQRLAFLGTLGNNAPFVGLFGTVLGIIRAFHDLSASSAQGTQAVMSGIAEALVATAVGLLVALPAVASYNAFVRHVETSAARADAYAHEILEYLKARAATQEP